MAASGPGGTCSESLSEQKKASTLHEFFSPGANGTLLKKSL